MATTLREYRKKRDFQRTPEPSGRKDRSKKSALRFVVQKHAARRLHYDFRLELDGVLKSWAVPKGPSYNPADKRLAVEVEDHPLEYATFEGVIPEGEYGGGTVMLWDEGTWEPEGNAAASLKKGKIVFTLRGHKLHGQWTLVRSGMKDSGRRRGKPNWLLIKKHDQFARDDSGAAWLEAHSRSVASERTMEEISGRPAAVWSRHGRTDLEAPPPAAALQSLDASSISGARKSRQPGKVAPQLATLADEPPRGEQWLHEVKFDGYRLLAIVQGGKVRLITRAGKDWTDRFAGIADAVAALGVDECILDGEVVVLDAQGRSQFQLLQNALSSGGAMATPLYYVFDLLHFEGYDLTGAALTDRKALLAAALQRAGLGEAALIRYSDHIIGHGEQVRRQACEMQLEGIVSKRADSKYRSRRTRDWIKAKCVQEQEFIIIGYTKPGGARTAFGALALGYHDQSGRLVYCGRVGTGFTERSLRDLHAKLKPMARERPPAGLEVSSAQRRGVTWVEPKLVAEVTFQEWTSDGHLRHPVFHGLREDKPAKEIVRETPSALPPTASPPETSMHKSNGQHKSNGKHTGNGKTKRTRRRDEPVVGGVALSHPDRVLYPEQGITKRQLAEHYDRVADLMMPHLLDRPLALVRCPEGQGAACFFQKHYRPDLPGAVTWIESKEKGQTEKWISVSRREGLISLAQIGVLEVHPWGSRADDLDRPDRMILDLDPGPGVEWAHVVEAAHDLHARLEDLGLETFVKTTGGKGLHLVTPLTRRTGWDEVKDFAHAIANLMAREQPGRYVSKMTKSRRQGRIYIDYVRNTRGATAAAPYSPRARPGAPVSMPISWSELAPKLTNDQFTIATVAGWIKGRRGDPWKGLDQVRQSITAARQRRLAKA